MNRRTFLATLGVGTLGALKLDSVVQALAAAPPGAFAPAVADREPYSYAINRLTFGMTPELYEQRMTVAVDDYITTQLNPTAVDDSRLEEHLAPFPTIQRTATDLLQNNPDDRTAVLLDLLGGRIVRSLYSERQLFERMTQFWSDHFHVFAGGGPMVFYKVDDDRFLREQAMGGFRGVLGASAASPAMLYYLDNALSRDQAPNENYARELLELHTLGVDGGYTEQDVKEVARCFTGWSVTSRRDDDPPGQFVFRARAHDPGDKVVLGQQIPANGGIADGQMVLDLLASHPSTARFVSAKLVRRFVADVPAADLVDDLAQIFLTSNGDITALMTAIVYAEGFWNAPPKFKRPFEFVISLMRVLDYQIEQPQRFVRWLIPSLQALGQVPFMWPAPDGYPDVGAYWMQNLLPRWNITLGLLGGTREAQPNIQRIIDLAQAEGATGDPETTLMFLGRYLYGRELTDVELTTVRDFALGISDSSSDQLHAAMALLLCAPAFQYK